MSPQNTQPPSPAPGPPVESSSQNSTGLKQFDFMLKDQPKPPGRFRNLVSWMPRPAKIALAAVGVLFILVILYASFFGGKTTNVDQLTSVAAGAQEIARISDLVKQQSTSSDTQAFASTVSASLSSQEQQFKAYLKSQKIKVNSKKLAVKLDKSTDTKLATAQKNNNYDQAYFDYLKINLINYQESLNTASQKTGKNARAILSAAYQSVQTLLTAPQLKQ